MESNVQAALEALKPCPFCGHDRPEFERMGTPRQSCIVVCGNCGCRHESSDEGDRCGTSWNERAALAPAVPNRPVAEVLIDSCADHQSTIEAMAYLPAGTMLYAAPQPTVPSTRPWIRRNSWGPGPVHQPRDYSSDEEGDPFETGGGA